MKFKNSIVRNTLVSSLELIFIAAGGQIMYTQDLKVWKRLDIKCMNYFRHNFQYDKINTEFTGELNKREKLFWTSILELLTLKLN